MLRVCIKIKIGEYLFDFANEVSVKSSWKDFTDTATIVVPKTIWIKEEKTSKKVFWESMNIVGGENPLIKRGDAVTIDLGYDFKFNRVFEGYVSAVKTKIPVEIECEDAMWKLKQKNITKSYKSVNLKTLLTDLVTGTEGINGIEATDQNLGPFRINNANVVRVLEELQKNHGVQSFIRDGILYSGLAYVPKLRKNQTFRFSKNIITDDLEYRKSDDVRLKVKVISMYPDQKKQEAEYGDPDGEQRTIHLYNVPLADLKKVAQNEIERIKYTGYYGTMETFGEPFVRHGDGAVIEDLKLPERKGTYLIKSVTYKAGVGGYRQEIELDSKIA